MPTFLKKHQRKHRFGHLEPVWNQFGHSKYRVFGDMDQQINYGGHT